MAKRNAAVRDSSASARAATTAATKHKNNSSEISCNYFIIAGAVIFLYAVFVISAAMMTNSGSSQWDQRSIVRKLPNGVVHMNLKGGTTWLQVMLHELSIEQVVVLFERSTIEKQTELMNALPPEQQHEFSRAILLAKGPVVGTERGGFTGGGYDGGAAISTGQEGVTGRGLDGPVISTERGGFTGGGFDS